MISDKPNPTVQGGAGNDLLGRASQFSDSNTDWRAQLIASRYSVSNALAPIVMALAYGEMSDD